MLPPQTNLINNKTSSAITALFATILSIFAFNGYRFGAGDHAIILPFINHTINPALYPNDYLIAQKPFFLTFLWDILAKINHMTTIPLYILFFTLYLLSLYFTFMAICTMANIFFNNKKTSQLATILCAANIFSPLGGVNLIENSLLTRSAALPLIIFALISVIKKKYIKCAILAGAAFLIHPITAMHGSILIFCSAITQKEQTKEKTTAIIILMLSLLPLIIKKLISGPTVFPLFALDHEWYNLMLHRSTHHILIQNMDISTLLKFFILVVTYIFLHKNHPQQPHVSLWIKAILISSVASIIFTQIVPIPLIIQCQFLRITQFFIIITLIYTAQKIIHLSKNRPRIILMTMLVVIFFGINGKCLNFSAYNNQEYYWQDIQKWANISTPMDAYFITPPDLEGFRVESQRTTYVEYKDGTQMFFNVAFGKEWKRRMDDATVLTPEKITAIKKNLQAKEIFIVTDIETKLPYPKIYSNKKFVAYKHAI